MSSSTTTILTTPTPPPPPPDSGDGGNNSGDGVAQRGANYFFGFLITFVVLLLIFVGCGIGSRRRYLARRQTGLFIPYDPWGAPRAVAAQTQPVLYEQYLGAPRLEDKWAYTTPLSLTLLRQPKEAPPPTQDTDLEAAHAAADPPTQSGNGARRHALHPRVLTALTIPFHERKHTPPPEPEKTEYGGPEALDIAVMIVMPSPQHSRHASSSPSLSHTRRNSDSTVLPDMQIGVATVPWHTEIEIGSVR